MVCFKILNINYYIFVVVFQTADVRFFLFITTFFLLSGQTYLSGQRKLTTLSGQKITVRTDNSWEYDSVYLQDKNTLLEKYYSDMNHLDRDQMGLLKEVILTAQHNEINLAILCDRQDYSIARMEVDYFEARRSKNKERAQQLKKELQLEKSSLAALLNEYENGKSTLDKLFSLPAFSVQDQMSLIVKLAGEYGIDIPDTTQKSNLNDLPGVEKTPDTEIETERLAEKEKNKKNKKLKEKSPNTGIKVPETRQENRKEEKSSAYISPVSQKIKTKQNSFSEHPFEWDYKAPDCLMSSDSENLSRYAATQPQRLLGYAPDRASQYFRDTYLLEVITSMVKEKGHTSLLFRVEMASRDAAKNYGQIERGALIKLVGINGAHVNLTVSTTSVMSVEPVTGEVIYEFACSLSKKDIRSLKKAPLDFMGIMWTSGFETYPVYEVDIIMQQIKCLDIHYNKKKN